MKVKFAFRNLVFVVLFLTVCFSFNLFAQATRTFSGIILTPQFEIVPNAAIEVQTSDGKINVQTDAEGRFSLQVPNESLSVKISGKNIEPQRRIFSNAESLENIQIKTTYTVPPINENVTIQAESLTPQIENRNDTIYKK